jgi:transposase-like protein
MYKTAIKKEIREEILTRVKEGKDSVAIIAKQYGISSETVYYWLHQGVEGMTPHILGNNRLRKENEALNKIIGELVLEKSRGKKG